MRVAFFGTPMFAVPTLDALVEAGHEVVVVVAQPDKPAGRGNRVISPPTVERARALGIPVLQPIKVRSGAFPEAYQAMDLDVGVVVAYGRILTPLLLHHPRRGCVNVHGSLLPRWRGAAPIQWALIAGDERTGITTMRMDEGLDTGDILLKEETIITPEDTAGSLHDRLAPMGARLLVSTLARLDEIVPQRQDGALATHAPMLEREHGWIDWSRGADQIDRQVRGLTPWPGTFTTHRGEVLKVLQVRPWLHDSGLPPGTVLPAAHVACGEGDIELVTVQQAGRKAVRGVDWMNGARVVAGEQLGEGPA